MNNLQIFNFQDTNVRTIINNNETWFVLKDVCDILGIKNHKDVPQRLDEDEVGRFDIPHPQSPSKTIGVKTINESGLWNVIIRSDSQLAKPLRKFITSEVLPTIRKTGSYGQPQLDVNTITQIVTATIGETIKQLRPLMEETKKPKTEKLKKMNENEIIEEFIKEHLLIGKKYKTPVTDIHKAFEEYSGQSERSLIKKIIMLLEKRNISAERTSNKIKQSDKTRKSVKCLIGVKLKYKED